MAGGKRLSPLFTVLSLLPYEYIALKVPSGKQKLSLHQAVNRLVLQSQTSTLTRDSCVYKEPSFRYFSTETQENRQNLFPRCIRSQLSKHAGAALGQANRKRLDCTVLF